MMPYDTLCPACECPTEAQGDEDGYGGFWCGGCQIMWWLHADGSVTIMGENDVESLPMVDKGAKMTPEQEVVEHLLSALRATGESLDHAAPELWIEYSMKLQNLVRQMDPAVRVLLSALDAARADITQLAAANAEPRLSWFSANELAVLDKMIARMNDERTEYADEAVPAVTVVEGLKYVLTRLRESEDETAVAMRMLREADATIARLTAERDDALDFICELSDTLDVRRRTAAQ